MSRHWTWLGGLISLWVGIAAAQSTPDGDIQPARSAPEGDTQIESVAPVWQRDVWHYVTPNTPFFTEERRDLHSAGVLQEDGRFALLLLGTPDQGALVSVNVPGAEAATTLTSDLVMPSGNVLSRRVTEDQLLAMAVVGGESHTYSFRVAPADLELFKGAIRWRVSAAGETVVLTLKGSRKAITEAIQRRDDATALTSASE